LGLGVIGFGGVIGGFLKLNLWNFYRIVIFYSTKNSPNLLAAV
jgi:hypothetical protein